MRGPVTLAVTGSLGHWFTDDGRYVSTVFIGGQTPSEASALLAEKKRGGVRAKSLIRRRFGFLRVVARTERPTGKLVYWDCVCDCGKTVSVDGVQLRSGNRTSCDGHSCPVARKQRDKRKRSQL